MEKFLEICSQLGVDNISLRADKLAASIPALCSDSILFFICGHDFIFKPHILKFTGIANLFIAEHGEFPVNIYPECRTAVLALLGNPTLSASIEGTSVGATAGVPVRFDPALMRRQGGVQAGGVGNYNLQTKALELMVTHPRGMDFQGTIRNEIIPKFNASYAKRGTVSDLTKETLTQMRTALTPYWGADIRNLGL